MSPPLLKSNGMIDQTSTFAPSALPCWIRRWPSASGPEVVVPMVTTTLRPGLLAFTVFSAPSTRSCTEWVLISVASMSMSMAFNEYWVITFW